MSSTYYLSKTQGNTQNKSCILEPKTIGHSHDQIRSVGMNVEGGRIGIDSKNSHASQGRNRLLRGLGDSYVINADIRSCQPGFETVPITSSGGNSRSNDFPRGGIGKGPTGMAYCVRRVSDAPAPSRCATGDSSCTEPSPFSKEASLMYGTGGYDLTAANTSYITNSTSPYGSVPGDPRRSGGYSPYVNPREYPSGSDPTQLPPNYTYNVSRGYISREIDYDGIGIYKSREMNTTPIDSRGENQSFVEGGLDISSIASSRPTYISRVNASLGDENGRGRVYDKRLVTNTKTRSYIAPRISRNVHRPHLFEALDK